MYFFSSWQKRYTINNRQNKHLGGIVLGEIKQLGEADYHEVFSLSQFAFQYELSKEDLMKKKEEASRHQMWGWMVEGNLAAKVHIIPLASYINGETFEMGGIASVATWPEYRRQGMIKNLLFHALQEMKKNGQTISLLSPFSIPFYRKYGWELAFSDKKYDIPIGNLKREWDGEGYVRRIKQNIPLLHDIYTTYAQKLSGMLTRDEKWWEHRVLTDPSAHIAVAYNEAGEAEGYLIYKVKDRIFTVIEMAYTSLNGQKLLLEFIANHDSMVKNVKMIVPENNQLTLLVDDPRFDQKITPYFMARIVDVLAFLKQYPFRKGMRDQELLISVEDAFFPENSGTYKLTKNATGMEVEKGPKQQSGIQCTVQQLTVMLLGYKRPSELYDVGLIHGNIDDIKHLEKLIPEQQTFLSDFF